MALRNIKTILSLISVVAIGGFLFFWFGMFNVAATDKHWAITTAFLEWVRDRSISSNVEDLKVPNLTDEKLIASGAPNYAAMCAQCHLSPGETTSEFYEGLNPQPPVFHKGETHDRNPVAAFWIISNGIKMTGMAAWGSSHTNTQIWEMIAFINVMPSMNAAAYKKLVGDGKHSHKGGGHGEAKNSTLSIGHHAASKKGAPEGAKQAADQHGAASGSDHHATTSQASSTQATEMTNTSLTTEQPPLSYATANNPSAMQQNAPPSPATNEQNPHSHAAASSGSPQKSLLSGSSHSSKTSMSNGGDSRNQGQHSHSNQSQYDSNQHQHDNGHQQYYYDNDSHHHGHY